MKPRRRWIVALTLACAFAIAYANPQSPTGSGGAAARGDAASPPASGDKPLVAVGWVHPPVAAQLDVCAIVKLSSDPTYANCKTLKPSAKSFEGRYVVFDVKVVDGVGTPSGVERRCFAPAAFVRSTGRTSKPFLLLGWGDRGSKRLHVAGVDPLIEANDNSAYVEVGKPSLFAWAVIPTEQDGLVTGKSPAGRAYNNLAVALASGTEPSAVRQITYLWASVTPGQADSMIDGEKAYTWLPAKIGPILGKAKPRNATERFRIGGLLADWMKPQGTIEYIRRLPALLKETRKEHLSEQDRESDAGFLRKLNLYLGMDPDLIVSLAFSDPELRFMALDGRLGIPSVEWQKRMLEFLDDRDIYTRATAFSRYANWYGMRDWNLNSVATSSPDGRGTIIPNESEMYAYWHKKLEGPPRP